LNDILNEALNEAGLVYVAVKHHDNGKMQPTGISPESTSDSGEAYTLLRRDGAVRFSAVGAGSVDAEELAHRVFGNRVRAIPDAARVFVGGEMDRYEQPDHQQPLKPHTDGFAYGDCYPDYVLLSCVQDSARGGESFLVDGYGVLDNIAATDPGLASDLQTVRVDQTEEDMQLSHSPIIQFNDAGRRLLRRNFSQKPLPDSLRPDQDQAMIDAWEQAVDAAGDGAPRFKLMPGEALIIDNYRVLHARAGYRDLNRMMWRVWIWTQEALGVPDLPLHSDSRFAARD